MKKKFLVMVLLALVIFSLAGCRQSERVSYNISKEADNFNVIRRLSVINARTDNPILELIGAFSISNNGSHELEVTCQTGENEYKKHLVYLNEWTLYVVEDIDGASVSPYKYEINFLPEMIQPIDITSSH